MHRLAVFVIFYMWILSDGLGQCLADRHNTSLSSNWISCLASDNPVSERGQSHWIMYELDDVYTIEGIRVWNINHPNALGYDVRELAIDYSDNGVDWSNLGTFDMPLASGSSRYTGDLLEGIEEFSGRYVVLTALTNYGANCSGLAEVRFDLTGRTTSVEEAESQLAMEIFPNPFSTKSTIRLRSAGPGVLRWWIRDALGRVLEYKEERAGGDTYQFEVDGRNLATGYYFLTVVTSETATTRKLSVVHPQN